MYMFRQMKISLKCNPLQSDPKFTALGEPHQSLLYVSITAVVLNSCEVNLQHVLIIYK